MTRILAYIGNEQHEKEKRITYLALNSFPVKL